MHTDTYAHQISKAVKDYLSSSYFFWWYIHHAGFATEVKGMTHTGKQGSENMALIDFRLYFSVLDIAQWWCSSKNVM